MIQPHELRIGNYVNYEQTTHVITGLLEDIVRHNWHKAREEAPYVTGYEEIKGIELTGVWLEKAGFRKLQRGIDFMIHESYEGGYSIEASDDTILLLQEGQGFYTALNYDSHLEKYIYIPFYYLHQLQNLFFSLTGKELEIKDI